MFSNKADILFFTFGHVPMIMYRRLCGRRICAAISPKASSFTVQYRTVNTVYIYRTLSLFGDRFSSLQRQEDNNVLALS